MGALKDSYDVVVIGAGIGGLTCAALLAKKGLSVLIAEQHSRPGGYCTSFRHSVMLEKPAEFNQLLRQFIDEQEL